MNFNLLFKSSFFKAGGRLTKTMLIMRIVLVLILATCLQVSATTFAQKVTLSESNVSLEKLCKEIHKQTGYNFFYKDEWLKEAKSITVNQLNVSLTEALDACLQGQSLTYSITGKTIVLQPKISAPSVVPPPPIFITGKVTNEKGESMPNANVLIKGTAKGTATDIDGNFKLNADVGQVLMVTYVGYEPQEIKITSENKKKPLTFKLVPKNAALGEVTITGYQTIEKRYLTSSVTTLKMDDIKVPGVNTIDKLLEGHVPGMIFMQNSGQIGATPQLRIRGSSTILGNQEPLWVVDGIVQTDPVNVDPAKLNDFDFVNLLGNAISGLNPEDVEQIDVLKDASSTALYGARAANGVIVITTKKGKIGPPSLRYSVTSTFSRRPRYSDASVNLMDSKDRVDVSREMFDHNMSFTNVTNWVGYEAARKDYDNGLISFDKFKTLSNYYETVNTDWLGLVCTDALSTNHTLSLSGGEANTRYYASLGYDDEHGTIKGEGLKSYSTSMKVNTNYGRFNVEFGLQGNVSTKTYNPTDLGVMNYAYGMSRAIPAFNADGSRYTYGRYNGYNVYNFNILNEMDNSGYDVNGNTLSLTTVVGYKLTKDLKLNATLNYSIGNNKEQTYYTENTYYINGLRRNGAVNQNLCPLGGELRKSDVQSRNYTMRLQADYNKYMGIDKQHYVNVSLGGEVSSKRYDGFSITRRGYSISRGTTFLTIPSTYTGYYSQWASSASDALGVSSLQLTNLASAYATATYSYKDRYVFNINSRVDASNNFGTKANDKLLPIWSVSGRWDAKKDVLQDAKWINALAFRSSFGFQGNMLDNQTNQMIIRLGPSNPTFNENYSTILYYPNPDLKWEKTASMNYSVDFSLFNNKLNGTLTYYHKVTNDAFLNKNISDINGQTQYVINQGQLKNSGFEIALNFTPINKVASGGKQGFVWRIDPQIGQVVNQLISKAINNQDNVLLNTIQYIDLLTGSAKLSGQALGTFYSYKFEGLSHTDGSPIFYGAEPGNATALNTQYTAMNANDVYFAVMTKSGTRIPVLQGGISNTFGYGNFGLEFNLAYSFGNKIRLLMLASNYATTTPYPQDNMRQEWVNRWRQPGDENYTNIPGLKVNNDNANTAVWWNGKSYSFAQNVYQMYDNSDIRVVKGDYVKLQSLSFRYSIPGNVCKKMGVKSVYVNLTGSNLFTIADKRLKGQDPTQSGSSGNINLAVYPTYSCNLSITF